MALTEQDVRVFVANRRRIERAREARRIRRRRWLRRLIALVACAIVGIGLIAAGRLVLALLRLGGWR